MNEKMTQTYGEHSKTQKSQLDLSDRKIDHLWNTLEALKMRKRYVVAQSRVNNFDIDGRAHYTVRSTNLS